MSDDNNFYQKFNSNSPKKTGFASNIFIPFVSGLIGATLAVAVILSSPNIKNSISSSNAGTNSNSENSKTQAVNSGVVDYVSLNNYSDTATYAASKVLPSIVGITVEYTVTSNFSRISGSPQIATAEGSGVIMSTDGYILTNNHIINSSDTSSYYSVSEATNVYVYLYNDETPYEAKIIGTDEQTDLAVIKIDKNDLTAAEIGDSNSIKIGEFAMAIGNPLGMQSSVTSGIISALNRTVTSENGNTYTLIQTDAAINAGNSGGALVNSEGKVIGINTLKLSGTGIEGMGFAIPINDTINIYNELIKNGKVIRPYIGIGGINLNEITANYYKLPVGIYVQEIYSNTPASKSDLKVGDVITKIDGTEVSTMNELNTIKNKKNIGDEVTLDVYRSGETIQVKLTLGETP